MAGRPPIPEDQQPKPRFKKREEPKAKKQFDPRDSLKGFTDLQGQPFPFLNEKISDAAAAIAATSLLDDFLKLGVIIKFRRRAMAQSDADALFKYPGPLSSFSAKINLAAVLGILPNDVMRDELDIMRDIRNAFCHTRKEVLFSDEEIAKKCARLTYSTDKTQGMGAVVDLIGKRIKPLARAQFVISALMLMQLLSITMMVAQKEAEWAEEHHAELYANAKADFTKEFNARAIQAIKDFSQALRRPRPE